MGQAPDSTPDPSARPQGGRAGGPVPATASTPSGAAPTIPTRSADDAPTVRTAPLGGDATLAADLSPRAAGGDATLVPDQAGEGTGALAQTRRTAGVADTAGGETRGLTRGTGGFTRSIRTRVNASLPADTQALDAKLQLSRPSVLVDMAVAKGDTLPPGLKKLIEQQGTEGRYAVNRPLAAGGMGAVLDITDHDFQRGAAMKVIHGRFARSPEALERFLAEAQVTAQLEHPNIVPIHDLGVMEDGTLYFTMKLIEGQSLGTVVRALKAGDAATAARWPVEERLLAFLKVLDGVGFAHSRGVVHRDIKPDNIMIGAHGEVLVVDWGIAKITAGADIDSDLVKRLAARASGRRPVVSIRGEDSLSATLHGAAMGTLFYMPPEQAAGELALVDARSDIYALGATLYELLALRRPLDATSQADMLARTINGELIPLATAAPGLHPDLVAIVGKAMAHAQANRYHGCAAMGDDLRRYLAGQAVGARRRNPIERLGAWYGRHRRAVLASAGAALLCVAAVAGTTAVNRRAARDQADGLRARAVADDAAGRFQEALDAATGALALVPDDAGLIALKERAASALARDEQRRNDRRQAAGFLEQGRALIASNLREAEAAFKAGFQLDPTDQQLESALAAVRLQLDDQEKAQRQAQARAHVARGDEAVARARALAATDPAISRPLADALAAYKAAEATGETVDGTTEKIAAVAALRTQADQAIAAAAAARAAAETASADRRASAERSAEAKAALARGDFAAAAAAIEIALDRVPDDPAARALQIDIIQARRAAAAAAEQTQRRDQARADAAKSLARARAGRNALDEAARRMTAARLEVAGLETRLAGLPYERKAPLFAAHREARQAKQAVAEQWALTEAEAQSTLSFLADDQGAAPQVAEARAILAALYHGRLEDAREQRLLPEIAAFTNLLRRYDDGAYSRELGDQGGLAITGPAGTRISVRPLVAGLDTRLVGDQEAKPLLVTLPSPPVPLPKGRYQLSAGEVLLSIRVGPGEMAVAWPGALPRLAEPELPLRYVPAAGGRPAFMLGLTEVTQEQYFRFVTDPAVMPRVAEVWQRAMRHQLAENEQLHLMPRSAPDTGEIWQPYKDAEGRLVRLEVPAAKRGTPVTSIHRGDAEAFCAWLSARSGLTVRLPTRAEWRFAANAGDSERIYPWGEVFDSSLAVTALSAASGETLPVGASSTDLGPFGHVGLAGNAREWLADRLPPLPGGEGRGLIAGGAYSDENPDLFATTYAESVPPTAIFAPIGFRILVEIPP